MKMLLDTHVVLWWVNEHEKLSDEARSLLLQDTNILYLSIVSVWEIAIKTSLGKLTDFEGGVKEFLTVAANMPIHILPVEPSYIEAIERLPFIHRDPFDRMIVATAIMEHMAILTSDENILKYDVLTIS